MSTLLNVHANDIVTLITDTYRDGGATLYLWTDVPITDDQQQYIVGNGVSGFKYDAYNDFSVRYICVTDLADSLSTLAKLIHLSRYWQHLGYNTVGARIDDGTLYLDPGNVCTDLGDAIALAKSRGELSIYDVTAGECIDTSK